MSAERLREAAALLRERAEAASEFVPGRWETLREAGLGYVVTNDDGWVSVVGDQEGDHELAAYIATMSPPVALALADWLNEEAVKADVRKTIGALYFFPRPALNIADAILGDRP